MALTKVSYSMITGAPVNVKDFGAVGDGVKDDTDAIKAACDYLQQFAGAYDSTPGAGILYFPSSNGEIYATSGGITLPECRIEGNNTYIKPLGNPDYIFKLDLRYTTNTRRFTKEWYFGGFRVWSDRGFGVNATTPDFNHFLVIDGGWLIRSTIENIDVNPGVACRSLIEWDLTHPDIGTGVTEVGVPDGIVLNNISAQYAQNTSFAISFTGDGLGTGSRMGSTRFVDVYNSITYPHDYTTWGSATNDFGVIRVDTTRLSRCTFDEIYGTQPIKMTGTTPSVENSIFNSVYVEFNSQKVSDFESMFRSGTYRNCEFKYLDMYTENTNLTAPPRFFFATFENCVFGRINAFVQSIITNAPDADFINIGASSSGCEFLVLPSFENQPPATPGIPWVLQRMTVNVDTNLAFLDQKQIIQTALIPMTANGSYLLGSIPSALTQINANYTASVSIRAGSAVSANVVLRISGGGISADKTGPTAAVSAGSDAQMTFSFLGRTDLIAAPTYNQFSTSAVTNATSSCNGSATAISTDNMIIQFASGDYELYADVSSLSGSTDLSSQQIIIAYGYSREYVNIA